MKDKTFTSVRKALVEFFLMFGREHTIRTDRGPCFLCQFRTWAAEMGVLLETSSPRNPALNGLAESGVKHCKHINMKSHLKTQTEIDKAVMHYNCKEHSNGQGRPSDLFLK